MKNSLAKTLKVFITIIILLFLEILYVQLTCWQYWNIKNSEFLNFLLSNEFIENFRYVLIGTIYSAIIVSLLLASKIINIIRKNKLVD